MGRFLPRTVALVTGGTSGIGEAVVEALVEEGVFVAFTGRRDDLGTALVARLSVASVASSSASSPFLPIVSFIQSDHLKDCSHAVQETVRIYGGLDILVNNAGIVVQGTAETTTDDEWDATFSLNVRSVWKMIKYALPYLRQCKDKKELETNVGNSSSSSSGAVVNISSDWGLVGAANAMAYCASKGAVLQLTRCIALDEAEMYRNNKGGETWGKEEEEKDHSNTNLSSLSHKTRVVRVNAVCPGDTFVKRWSEVGYFQPKATSSLSSSSSSSSLSTSPPTPSKITLKQANEDAYGHIPLDRVASASEIAKAVLFLANGAESGYMTGTHIVVDGGNTCR